MMARTRLVALTALTGTLLTAASAQAASVAGGRLDWTTANVYETGAPEGTNRTWMGYTTAPGVPFTNGTVTASAGATGATVTPQSPRGADRLYTFGYELTSGSYDAAAAAGDLEAKGVVTFQSAAHGFTVTLEQPRVVLSGATGQLFASGRNAGSQSSQQAGTYDRSKPVFDLDLSRAQRAEEGGVTVISGIVPAIHEAGYAFPGDYAKGSGPDRTPPTFGTFTLRLGAPAALPPVSEPAAPPAATSPTPATAAPASAKVRRVTLARAPFAGPGLRRVTLRSAKSRRAVATGKVRGRQLTLYRVKGHKLASLSGRYLLRIRNAKRVREVAVLLP